MPRVIPAVLAALLLSSCSGGDDGRFVTGAEADISCMEHQSQSPGTAYTGGEDGDTAAILSVFRYYVANGAKGYCDGDPPTDEDLEWAQLVVDLGGSSDSVQPILDAG
ncbi:MAG: hypothetical protein H0T85_09280 [Geodermatophilaceae bacterium]|nr:hypothetical protein [Geodermatophilaceae bacterium]